MKSVFRILFTLTIFSLLTLSDSPRAAEPQRIQFRVTTIEEGQGGRRVISDATIEGPAGTDFTVTLQGERFKMNARFLTDLIAAGSLKVRARLDTRRLYGYSERELPLYEEDRQSQTIELGFEEQIVLLPFGHKDAAEKLKIEITPAASTQSHNLASGKPRPLEIDILKQSPNGEVSIQASKTPHNFEVEASLLEDGVEVARAVSPILIEEARDLVLQPNDRASREAADHPLVVSLTVDEYTRGRPAGSVGIRFNLLRSQAADPAQRQSLARRWAGIGMIDSELTYDLSSHYLKGNGRTYELRFKLKLAKNERAD